jgi:arylsulfatase
MSHSTPTRRDFLFAAGGAPLLSRAAAQNRTPNIVIILCDDLGYGDISPYGSPIHTPNLERMAHEGIRFQQFYSANPVCSPSRAALLTGRYPTRVNVPRVLFPKDTEGLARDEKTLADLLKAQGYKTKCVGKWHLGHTRDYLPTSRGFDEYFGIPYSNDMVPRPLMHNRDVIEQEATLETLTPRYTEQAVSFIEQSKGTPFFLYMPHTYPHIPLAASKRFRGKSAQGLYGDVVEEIDWSVGEVLAALKRTGNDANTLVLFTSDNGPWFQGSPGRLRGRKGMTWEGGVREPFLARWPGKIAAGTVCNGIASAMDIVPTVSRLCSAALPAKKLDGIDIWPMLSGKAKELGRDPLLYFDDWNLQCVRWKQWKMHLARYNSVTYSPAPAEGRKNQFLQTPELYDLTSDIDESYDVAPEHPDIVRDLLARVDAAVQTFPDEVRRAYAAAKKLRSPVSRPGALPAAPVQ